MRVKSKSLVYRLYALGLAQLAVVVLSAIAIGVVMSHEPPPLPPEARLHEGSPPPPFSWAPPGGLRPPEPSQRRRPNPWPPILTLFSGFLVVSGGAVLTARWITQPLGRIGGAVKAFGDGDLGARVALDRSDELGAVAGAFDEMAERIRTLLHSEKELLANVAHELRTPLSRIRVALEIAEEGDAETARKSLSEIGTDLAELETMVDDVLTAARLDLVAGNTKLAGFPLNLRSVAPSELVREAARRFRSRHSERPLELSVAEALPQVDADPMLFRRVLDNLLENSHKYTPNAAFAIELNVRSFEDGVCFEVKDRGAGVSDEDRARLFEPFFRGERSRSRTTGGVGLGLTLARRLVEAHGGTIVVESAVGAGTTVRVALPNSADATSKNRNHRDAGEQSPDSTV